MALSPRNSFKAISILVVFSFLVFFFRENLSYGGHKHAIGNSDLDFEEDYLRPNSPNIDANGFLHTNEAKDIVVGTDGKNILTVNNDARFTICS